jgi:uncharacterized phage protein gp47/JayE
MFVRPTLSELVERIQKDFESRLALQAPLLRRALVYVFSRVVAGAVHMLHGHLEYLARQIFPDLAEREYLLRWGALFGLSLKAAEFAAGSVVLVGTNGTIILNDAVLQRADGTTYTPDADATIVTLTAWAGTTGYTVGQLRANGGNVYLCTAAGTSAGSGGPTGTGTAITDGGATWRYIAAGTAAVAVAVTCSTAGADGNADIGTQLTFESPIAGANAVATVGTGGLANGSDEEDLEDFRARVLERMASPPHGGAASDYVAWAKEVAGVTRAWCYPLEGGAGTVTVRFVRDDDASLIPDAGEVTAVQAHINAVRPVTAIVTVAAPTAVPLNFTIHPIPDTTETRAAIDAELRDLLLREATPGGTVLLSHIRNAIGDADGVTDYTLTSPAADVTRTTGQLTTMGTITFT